MFLAVAATTATVCFFIATQKQEKIVTFDVTKTKPAKTYIRLLFVGDIMFDRGIRYYAQQNGGNEYIFNQISQTLKQNDLVVANLEGPITDNKSVSSGTAPGSADNYFFTFDPSVAQTLRNENINLVSLGNNHILNFGYAGISSTEKYLSQARVNYFGGPTSEYSEDSKSTTETIKNLKITFINYNQFANADDSIDQKATLNEIQKTKQFSDLVIVFCHWGVEYASSPTTEQIDFAHQFIDAGADLVIGSHPHVIQPSEEYNGKIIYYSLGNFIFDQYFNEDVRNGLGVSAQIDTAAKQMQFSEKHFYLQSGGQTIEKTANQ